MDQQEYIKKLKEKIEKEYEEKENQMKERIKRNYNKRNHRQPKHYTADEWGFSPAEVEVRDGNVMRAYKRLQKILTKDGTLKQYKDRRRFDKTKHKNQKR